MSEIQKNNTGKFYSTRQKHVDSCKRIENTIYVKNLDSSVTNSDILTHFKSCGSISGMNIVGQNQKRHAIVNFTSEKSVEISLILNGSVLKGKRIIVQKKKIYI